MAKKLKPNKKQERVNLGGWLTLFAISLSILSPIFILFEIFFIDKSFDFSIFLVNIIIIIFGIIIGVAISKRKEKAIIWAKEYLIARFFITIFDIVCLIIYSSDKVDPLGIHNAVRNFTFSVIWFCYLIKSKRVKLIFGEAKLNWKRVLVISVIAVLICFFIPFSYGFLKAYHNPDFSSGNLTKINSISTYGGSSIIRNLSSNHAIFRRFVTNNTVVNLSFSSTLPLDVYFVPSSDDYYNFLDDIQYNIYDGCFFENQTQGTIDCNISSGGILIYNPNSENLTYSIK